MKKFSIILMACLLSLSLCLPTSHAVPIEDLGLQSSTRAYLLGDFASGEVLEEYNIDETIEIASLTKLLAYYVAADKIASGEIKANDHVTITAEDVTVEGNSFKMQAGQVYMISELMEAMMILSANDATKALARHIGGTEETYIDMMEAKALELGLANCRLYNATGLPTGEGHLQNHMTTRELFILSRALINDYPDILTTTQKPFLIQMDRSFQEANTNQLIGTMPQIDGLKTGYTEKAGCCQVTTGLKPGVEKQTEPLRLIGIVMGCPTYDLRRDNSKALMEYGFESYERRIIGGPNEALGTANFSKGAPYEALYYAKEAKSVLAKTGETYDIEVEFEKNHTLPISVGEPIGKVTFLRGDEEVYTTDIILKDEIVPAGTLSLFQREFTKQIQTFITHFQ